MVWHPAHWALLASACTLHARCDMATRDECSVTVSRIAELAHLNLLSVLLLRLGNHLVVDVIRVVLVLFVIQHVII